MGKWIINSEGKFSCSICGEETPYFSNQKYNFSKFCPNCGEEMLIKDLNRAKENQEEDKTFFL